MASSTDYAQEYGKAEKAYLQGNYQEAASVINRLVEDFPEDPSALLLRGHIYCYGLRQYDVAREQYELVLNLTSDPDFVDYANNGLEYAIQTSDTTDYGQVDSFSEDFTTSESDLGKTDDLSEEPAFENWQELQAVNDLEDFDLESLNFDETQVDDLEENSGESFASDPFVTSATEDEATDQSQDIDSMREQSYSATEDPFAFATDDLEAESEDWQQLAAQTTDSEFNFEDFDTGAVEEKGEEFFSEGLSDNSEETFVMPPISDFAIDEDNSSSVARQDGNEQELEDEAASWQFDQQPQFDKGLSEPEVETSFYNDEDLGEYGSDYSFDEERTFLMGSGNLEDNLTTDIEEFEDLAEDNTAATKPLANNNYLDENKLFDSTFNQNGLNNQDIEFDNFDEEFGDGSFSLEDEIETSESGFSEGVDSSPTDQEGSFLDNFDVFGDDDLGSIPDFSLDDQEDFSNENTQDPGDFDVQINSGAALGAAAMGLGAKTNDEDISSSYNSTSDDEMFSISNSSEAIPVFNQNREVEGESLVSVEDGWLAPFRNASLSQKNLITATATGIASAVAVALVSFVSASTVAQEKPDVVSHLRKTGALMSLVGGLAGFGTTLLLGRVSTNQIKKATQDLQNQFESVAQGNFNATATIYSEGEFGQLASGFNQMARVILTTTSEAQRKAEEQEQAKEDLQRQVIRLLDDVEGAARGDLTVQAEVTADVLGAVADSFNLTIQNLREIVQQVKQAARQVTRSSTDSEVFARSLSSDALRQAEELAVTLNSVQVMTDLIQRVAESAGEAEAVARSASSTAQKGGEAVERTVAGILQIRETVAETTRKVKRLAESSQEISKIVAVISAVASRTNLLALNASIEAARAGEAGRGFAIVADEVRQLADRSAKALKEIEQIVLQIQSETGSVMAAMEEGTQQVIDGTRRAEQAKRALEDIVQVSNRIDALVRSIAADTVEQTQTSQAVAQVMQSVELTAQETSQEAQRVSGSLQNLVGVARDLLTSVERFRVESNDEK
ncbi:MAG: methyl-accepting chemotaxis protein [Coleofasciculaceae cyanobacterium]